MPNRIIPFEGADGADMTLENTGAQQIVVNGGTAKFSTATKQSGATGGRWVSGSGNCIARFMANNPNNEMAFEGVVTIPAATDPAGINLMGLRHTSGPGLTLVFEADNQLSVYVSGDAAGTIITTDGGSSAANAVPITLGGKYRVAIVASGGSTTASTFNVNLYTPTGTTPLGFTARTDANLSVNALTAIDLGVMSTGTPAGTAVGWDDVQLDDGATVEQGPLVSTLGSPTLTVTAADPSAAGASDGIVTASWTAVPNATGYESCILVGNVTTGATSTRSDGTRTRTFNGVPAGTRTVAVRAV